MLQNIDINRIFPHPNNPRADLGDLSELAESIKSNGILQNLTVVANPLAKGSVVETKNPCELCKQATSHCDKCCDICTTRCNTRQLCRKPEQTFTVLIGHRRIAAAQLAGLTEVPCTVADMDETTQIATMLLENMQRSDLTPYEQAHGIQLMLDLGDTVIDISKKTGFSETTVRRRVKLLELDKEKFKAAEERGATLADYAELDKISDIKLKNSVLDKIGTNNFHWELNRAVENERLEKAKKALLETLDSFAKRVEDREGYRARYLSAYHFLDSDFEVPEDASEVQYYYCFADKNDKWTIYLLTEKTEEESDPKADKAREERQARTKALEGVHTMAYKLRMEFAKTIKGNPKGSDVIEQTAAYCLAYEVGRIEEITFADFFNITKGFKPSYGSKEDDTRESFSEAKDRIFGEYAEKSTIEFLFVSAYLKIEISPKQSTFANWEGEYKRNERLEYLYEFLCKLGYEMSDEEMSLKDGTHELFFVPEQEDENDCDDDEDVF